MKLYAHEAFGIATLMLFMPLLPAVVLAVVTNAAIDWLGHNRGYGGIPVRAFRTHSVFTAPVVGIAVGLIIWSVPVLSLFSAPLYLMLAGGLVASGGHLLLDFVTEKGIYTTPHHRVGILHLGYSSPINIAVFLLSVLLIFRLTYHFVY